MSTVNLLSGDVEEDLRASVRALLADRCDTATLSAMYDDEPGPAGLWAALADDLGVAGLLVPEDRGGAGASAREAAVVMEQIGRAVAPVPYLTSAVVATTLLCEAGGGDLLTSLAEGTATAALTLPLSTGPGGPLPDIACTGGALHGRVRSVAGAIGADVLLVPVPTGDGADVYAVVGDRATVTPVPSLDMTRQVADVHLDGAVGDLVLSGRPASDAVQYALLVGGALLAAEQVGLARWCLDSTVDHLKERRQFGRVVGGYQALKHRLADLYVEVEGADAAATYAAATLAEGDPDTAVAATVAQACCSLVAVHCAEEALQLHGGIGMTWEHPVHLRLKRAKADEIALGSPGAHRARLAELVDLPGPTG